MIGKVAILGSSGALKGWCARAATGLACLLLLPTLQAATPDLRLEPAEESHSPIERGRYLARLGNCMSCHTVRGKKEYAGGRAIETPFGTVYSTNITPDPDTGIGHWTRDDFWRALHHGRSRDGRLLTPAFPYTSFTRITRADSDALHAYLQGVPPVVQRNRPQGLRFPFGTQAALWAWQTLYFEPGEFQPVADRSAEWNRGAYLVEGLGHCSACHTPRNALGAELSGALWAGGMIPVQNWYAPALSDAREAGVAHWRDEDVVRLLRTGVSPQASVMGPMAEVVATSTQYLRDDDARAMVAYLKSLVASNPTLASSASNNAVTTVDIAAAQLYETHCASCHGKQGQGEPGAFPALAGNRAVQMDNPTNVLRVILQGGYPPSTAGNPRPHGMPPFQQVLTDPELAAVASFVRTSWGNASAPVTITEAHRARERQAPQP